MDKNCLHFNERTFYWKISNFRLFPQSQGDAIFSPNFSLEPDGLIKLCLHLYPRGDEEVDNNEFASLHLVRDCSDNGPKHVFIDFKLILFDSELFPTKHSYSFCARFEKGSRQGRHKFIPRQTLLKNETYHQRGTFYVGCTFTLGDDSGEAYSPWICDEKDLECLSQDFGNALDDGEYCDVHLRSSDEILFKAHKAIMHYRFPNIAETLGSDENKNGEIAVKINSCTLHALLKYLYSGKFEQNSSKSISYESLYYSKLPHLETILFPYPSTEIASTTVNIKNRSFTWIIPFLTAFSKRTTLKRTFRFDEYTVFVISLTIKEKDSDEYYVCTSIEVLPAEQSLFVTSIIELCNTSVTHEKKHNFRSKEPCNISPFILKDLSLRDEDIKIIFSFEIVEFQTKIKSFHRTEERENQIKRNLLALQEDFKNLYLYSFHTDLTIRVGERSFLTHKCVLAARSSVFSKFLKDSNYKNKERYQRIVLNNIDAETVDVLLSYIYSGELISPPRNIKSAIKLYRAADRFKISQLKSKCMSYISHELNVKNIGEIMASVSWDEWLREQVIHFVEWNAYEIFNSLGEKNTAFGELEMSDGIRNISKEIQPDILISILCYLFHGKLDKEKIDTDPAVKVYEYASKHHLLQLKEKCISLLFHTIKPENVGKLFALCSKYNDELMKLQLREFVRSNVSLIIKSDEWKITAQKKTDLAEDMQNIKLYLNKLSRDLVFNVLSYIYCGKLITHGRGVFSIALLYFETCTYKLHLLKKKFVTLIGNYFTPENIGRIVMLSCVHNDDLLKECAQDFIHSNKEKILNSRKWRMAVEKLNLIEDEKVVTAAAPELKSYMIMSMLTYMYSGLPKYELDDLDFVTNLFIKACKYQLLQIRESCMLRLKQGIDARNIGKILKLAHHYKEKLLEEYVKTYTASNLKKILKSTEFETKIKEKLGRNTYNKISVLDLKKLTPDIMVSILSYIYSKTLEEEEFDLDCIIKMYTCANEIDVPKMKDECNSFFKRVISIENLEVFFNLSDKWNDDVLLSCMRNFVSSNTDEILKSKDWKTKISEKCNLAKEKDLSFDAETVESSTVFYILSIAYTGKINSKHLHMESLKELYTFAKVNRLFKVELECSWSLRGLIELENIGEMLKFADVHNDYFLKSGLLNFVSRNTDKILSSDYWANLIEGNSDFSGNMQNITLAVKSHGPEIVMNILTCIYCKRLAEKDMDLKSVLKLYGTSKEHELSYLSNLCITDIKRRLTSKNVGDVLISADAIQDGILKRVAYDFVCSNAKELSNSSEWKETLNEYPKIASDVLMEVLASMK